jgi:hypothetical protein
MARSKRIKDFQFSFMVATGIGVAGAAFVAIILHIIGWSYHVIYLGNESYSAPDIYPSGTIQLISILVGIAFAAITARKIMPGSPELTDEELRIYDNSLNKKSDEEKGI